jgi:hypothetical protein
MGRCRPRVWDFGGQHVLHAMHEFFLTARSLYLLVLGERDDMAERDAAYWLQLIRSYAGPAPVVVALNKSGGRAREMDPSHARRELRTDPRLDPDRVLRAGPQKERHRRPARRAHEGHRRDGRSAATLPGQVV